MSVAELLAASRVAHLAYRDAAGKGHSDGSFTFGTREKALAAVISARDYRQQADDADPTHTDPEWRNDSASHADLMNFYTRFIAMRS